MLMNAKSIILCATLFLLALWESACLQKTQPQTPRHSEILSTLRAEFQKHNPIVSRVQLCDIYRIDTYRDSSFASPNGYIVIARAIRPDFDFKGNFEDELFGVFLLDDSLCTISRTIDIIPTPRWNDYQMNISQIWHDTLTVHGSGSTYGDEALDKRYSLSSQSH